MSDKIIAEKIVDRRGALFTAIMTAASAAAVTAACSGPVAPSASVASAEPPAEPVAGTPMSGGGYKAVGVAEAVTKPIVLYCDLKVDPKREQECLDAFTKFKPVGGKFNGFIDLKLVKLRTLIQGDKLPAGVNYRFQLTYANEDLRQTWIASPEHAEFWPGIENTLTDKKFHVSLWDDVGI
jgi:hypothetical protein